MELYFVNIKWIRPVNDKDINRQKEQEGYIIVPETEIIDIAAEHIRRNMKPSEEFVSYGNYKPIITRYEGLLNGPVIEHYECSVPPDGHAISARLHCANEGDSPFIIEMEYECYDELRAFVEPTKLPLEKRI